MPAQIYKGTIIYTDTPDKLTVIKGGYVVVKDGIIEEVINRELPQKYDRNITHRYLDGKEILPQQVLERLKSM